MLEKLRSPETKQKMQGKAYRVLEMLRLVHVEKQPEKPEPFYAIIDGEPWEFTYENTHLTRCAQNPEFSSIVHTIRNGDGEITGGTSIYGQPEIMDGMEAQGFDVVDEELAEAQAHYHTFHKHGNEQARLN